MTKKKQKKVMFIASTGGHLSELLQLSPCFSKYDFSLVTEKTKSNMGLRDKYPNRVHYIISGTYTTLRAKLVYPFKLFFNSAILFCSVIRGVTVSDVIFDVFKYPSCPL